MGSLSFAVSGELFFGEAFLVLDSKASSICFEFDSRFFSFFLSSINESFFTKPLENVCSFVRPLAIWGPRKECQVLNKLLVAVVFSFC